MKTTETCPDFFAPIRKELAAVEETWNNCFREAATRTLKQINGFFRNSTGKRLRPGLTLLAAGAALGRKPKKCDGLINIASAIELLHTASLIHDDTIDGALIRHHQPTINARFGSHISIAFGDFVYSWALKLIAAVREPVIFSCFARRTFDLCEGEMAQITERRNLKMTAARYFSIIERKTASLFALSGESGVLAVAPNEPEKAEWMRQFGLFFGMAYQIIDDIRDLVADEHRLGKAPGADFQVAELTLPMIYLLRDPRIGKDVARIFTATDSDDGFRLIREHAERSDALKKARRQALAYVKKARACLEPLEDSSYQEHLLSLVDWLADKA